MKVLEHAGLLHRKVIGREHYCRVDLEPLSEAAVWLERQRAFWEARLDALERHVLAKRAWSRGRERSAPAQRRRTRSQETGGTGR